MRMLRWMSKVTKLDRIRDERNRGTTKVGEISKKVQESRLILEVVCASMYLEEKKTMWARE